MANRTVYPLRVPNPLTLIASRRIASCIELAIHLVIDVKATERENSAMPRSPPRIKTRKADLLRLTKMAFTSLTKGSSRPSPFKLMFQRDLAWTKLPSNKRCYALKRLPRNWKPLRPLPPTIQPLPPLTKTLVVLLQCSLPTYKTYVNSYKRPSTDYLGGVTTTSNF